MLLKKNFTFTIIFLLLCLGVTVESRNAFKNIARSHKRYQNKYTDNCRKMAIDIKNSCHVNDPDILSIMLQNQVPYNTNNTCLNTYLNTNLSTYYTLLSNKTQVCYNDICNNAIDKYKNYITVYKERQTLNGLYTIVGLGTYIMLGFIYMIRTALI